MKLAMTINYSGGDFKAAVTRVQDLEQAGLDLVWVPEAYSFDAISQIGYLAAMTSTVEIGTGILNVFSRTATRDRPDRRRLRFVSDGRFVLGLGASGPQVVEGFHGVAYDRPMPRIRDYIEVCRMVWRREPVVYDGATVQHPAAAGRGHRARQGAEVDQPPEAVGHPDLLGEPHGQERRRRRPATPTAGCRCFFDPEKFERRLGRRPRRRAGPA